MQTKTVNALKNLYISYGGISSDVQNINNIPDMLNALSTLDISSGGGQNEDTETVNALKELYVVNGGNSDDVTNIDTVSGMINAMATFNNLGNIDVFAEDGDSVLFEVQVSTYQRICIVYPEHIVGLWEEVEGGIADSGPLSGTGYFIALKFINNCNADKIEVGVDPSESNMGLVELDSDMNAVFKISNILEQKIIVKVTKDNISKTLTYGINRLVIG